MLLSDATRRVVSGAIRAESALGQPGGCSGSSWMHVSLKDPGVRLWRNPVDVVTRQSRPSYDMSSRRVVSERVPGLLGTIEVGRDGIQYIDSADLVSRLFNWIAHLHPVRQEALVLEGRGPPPARVFSSPS